MTSEQCYFSIFVIDFPRITMFKTQMKRCIDCKALLPPLVPDLLIGSVDDRQRSIYRSCQ